MGGGLSASSSAATGDTTVTQAPTLTASAPFAVGSGARASSTTESAEQASQNQSVVYIALGIAALAVLLPLIRRK